MEFSDLKLGDILFYDQPAENKFSSHEDDVSISHTAIVSHFTQGSGSDGGTIPWITHVSEKNNHALVMNPINLSAYEYSNMRYLAYRLKFSNDQILYGEKAAQAARLWVVCNRDAQWVDKNYYKSVPLVPHAFSWLTAIGASLRSSRFGSGATSYVKSIEVGTESEPGLHTPTPLANRRFPFRGMSCSMLVISAYQAVMGVYNSIKLLALDARATLPWTFEKYLRCDNRFNWQRLGYLGFVHS